MDSLGIWRAAGAALVLACTSALALTACSSRADSPETASGERVVEEARVFMTDYARDLLAGDRAAIAARYDRNGAYALGNGRKEFTSYDSIVSQYRGSGWSPPSSFEWRDLSFEPAGPDAVVVAGRFLWGTAAGTAPLELSYTALLRRQGGVLRIRLEDESVDPGSLPAARPPGDSASRRPPAG